MLHNPYSSHHHEVPNPSSPYDGQIPHGLVPGKQIYIAGHARPHADRIQFNLLGRGGHVLHINPRFHDNVIVRNSENYGAWGAEERSGPFLFGRGQPFELIISVEQDRYRVAVNGQPAFDFFHRAPLQEVERLNIQGDVDVRRIVFSGGYNSRATELFNPPVPLAVPLTLGAQPGRLIQVNGVVPGHANRFDFNLQDGPGAYPPNINFHFSCRFDQNAIVRNHSRHGGWGSEERHGHVPFQRGAPFELLILIEPHEFKVAVNGQHYTTFAHRNQLHEANHFAVNGDVQLTSVRQF